VVPVIQFIRQPPRVGLGAQAKPQENKRPEGWIPKPGESRDPPPVMALPKDKDGKIRHWKTRDEKLKPVRDPFSTDSRLYITGGPHSGLIGTSVIRQGDNVVVRLFSDEKVIINIKHLRELDPDEPIPSSPSKSLKTKPKSHKKDKSKKSKSKSKSKSSKRNRSSSTSSSSSSSDTTSKKPNPQIPAEPRWIIPDIRVKICSKELSEGRYYCKYAWIIDVLADNRCDVRIEDSGVLLENVKQADLETVVPASGSVKVVRGEYCGELGTVYEKVPAKLEVYVQLEDNLEILKMSYDDVAQVR